MHAVQQNMKRGKSERVADFLVKQLKENKTRFFTAIITVIAIIVFGAFIYARLQTIKVSASDKLASAYGAFYYGNQSQGLTFLDETIKNYPNTPASFQARLIKADLMINAQNFDEAFNLLEETVQKGKPEIYRPLALSRIIYMYDQRQDYPSAIMHSNEFINKYKNNFLIKDVYLNLARLYLLAGSKDDAVRVYNEILTTFPATKEAANAQEILKRLG